MIRIGKAFGLTLLAALALSALAAAGAQAQSAVITASGGGTVSATTTQTIGSNEEYFETIGRKVECETATFSGTVASGKNASVTAVPDYKDHTQGGNCKAGGTLVTTVTENGCDYVFHALATESGQTDFTTHVEVVCPAGQVITVHVRNLLNSADACTITVGSQTATGTLTVKNTAAAGSNKDDIDISGSVNVNATVHSNNTALCGVEAGKSKEEVTHYVISDPVTIASTTIELTASD